MKKNITIIGTGAYGTVLANVLADSGNNVIMYGIVEEQVDDINIKHMNSTFFENVKINENIKATMDLSVALENAEYLVLGVPTAVIKNSLADIKKYLKKDVVIINTAKGIDDEHVELLSKMIIEEMTSTGHMKGYCGLYGPSVAIEVINRKPTYVNVASYDKEIANEVSKLFTNEYFIAEPSYDLPGCELAAALKNVIAIAAGMVYEMKLGDNAHASLLTIGLNEMYKISTNFGARVGTFLNYASMGDLILTASSVKSRNFTLGRKIVEFGSASKAMEEYKLTVEGVGSAKAAHNICKKYNISSNLFDKVYEIIYNDKKPELLINALFTSN